MRVFLICPVRGVSEYENDSLMNYVGCLEAKGCWVHWPTRDTNQHDCIGYNICSDNVDAIRASDEVHIWWQPGSQGSLFDLGAAFALGKKIRLANPGIVIPTVSKSFDNLLLYLDSIK